MDTIKGRNRFFSWFFSSARLKSSGYDFGDNGAIMPIYREAAFRYISLSITLILLPFLISNYVHGHYLFALLETGVMLLLCGHCWGLFRYNRPLLGPIVLASIVPILRYISFYYGRGSNIYWAPPMVVSFYFILPPRQAQLFCLGFLLCMTPISLSLLASKDALAFMVSLLVTWASVQIFSTVVYRQERRLQRMAVLDPLTGAYNRRYMMESLEQSWASFQRHHGSCPVAMFDIDHFKLINDELGHAEGDRVLEAICSSFKQRLRKEDRLFRYGGEEFLVLLQQSELEQAHQISLQFCQQVRDARILGERPLTISCGVAQIQTGDSVKSLLQRCDDALYRAKQNGRDRVELCHREQGSAALAAAASC